MFQIAIDYTRTARKCQRRCVRVYVSLYIYIMRIYVYMCVYNIVYRCKCIYYVYLYTICIRYYIIYTQTRVCSRECVCRKNGIGASLQLLVLYKNIIACVCVRGKHDRLHLVPRPPRKKQFCSNFINSTSRVLCVISYCIIIINYFIVHTHTHQRFSSGREFSRIWRMTLLQPVLKNNMKQVLTAVHRNAIFFHFDKTYTKTRLYILCGNNLFTYIFLYVLCSFFVIFENHYNGGNDYFAKFITS